MEENLGTVIRNLTAIIVVTNETVDQNSDSIRLVRAVLTEAAAILQRTIDTPSLPAAVVEQVSSVVLTQQ